MNGLRTVDAHDLPAAERALLRPGETVRGHALPRYFYEIESWAQAKATNLTPHFTLAELTMVDLREHRRFLREWPRYVPCAVGLLAACLEVFRAAADGPVHLCANGGYRSPAHARSTVPDPHCWGVAADVYRVGSTWLETEEAIAKYAKIARELPGEVFVREYAPGDDHLHLDLGYLQVAPREAGEGL